MSADGLSSECLELASAWLRECLASHQDCNNRAVLASTRSPFPKRLIDIGDTQHPPRLVIPPAGSTGDYVALSHCWGKGPRQPLTTTTATLSERQHAIPLSSMPLTFQHAAHVTRRLGFRHLWIDSLCIIQDSPADWEEQAGQMQQVYAGAVVTIAADAGRDSGCGRSSADGRTLFRGVRIPKENLVVAPAGESGETPAHFVRAAEPTVGNPLAERRNAGSVLQTRGWTFQERALAPRMLHFGEHELAWECASAIVCECHGDRRVHGGRTAHDTIYNAGWCTQPGPGASLEFSRRWMALVGKYSSRALTYSSDKLPALAGLAQQVARSSSCTYLAGHWREDLGRTLLWTAGLLPLIGGGRRHADYQAPSWSWASMDGVEIFPNIDPESEVTLKIKGASCSPRHDTNPFGAVRDASLEVECFTAPVTVSERRDLAAGGYSVPGNLRNLSGKVPFMKTVATEGDDGHVLSRDGAPEPTYPDVLEFAEFDLGATYMFVEVVRNLKRGVSRGLIVRSSRRVPGAYERVGVHESSGVAMSKGGTAGYVKSTVVLV